MKNNIKGLAAYAVYILLSFFILYYGVLYVQTFIAEEGFFQAFMRFVVFVVVLILPVGLGALMLDAKQPKEKDFFNGLLVIAVAFILYIIAIITTKGNPVGMIPLGAEGDGWRFFKFFAMPAPSVTAVNNILSKKDCQLAVPSIAFSITFIPAPL